MNVSYDVDTRSRYGFASGKGLLHAIVGDVLKRRDFKSALFALWIRLNSKAALYPADPANTFDWIMDVAERHDLTSGLYFICGRIDACKDADYEPQHPAIRTLMCRYHARGHEIALHPSYGSYQSPEITVAEAARLRRVASEEGIEQAKWGGRMHYLRWEQAGMNYDSTLSYVDGPSFRCGTCFECPTFDLVAGEPLSLRVRPLVAMECSVKDSCYLGLGSGQAAQAKLAQLKNAYRAAQGCFTMLWHNSRLLAVTAKFSYAKLI